MTQAHATSIFERLGGDDALTLAVELFYERVLGDPALAHRFVGVNMGRLRDKQVKFFAAALGGPKPYRGRSMEAAHGGLGITQDEFDRTAGHLVAVLQQLAVPQDVINDVVSAVVPLAPSIVHVPSPSPKTEGTPVKTTVNDKAPAQAQPTHDDVASFALRFDSMLENAPTNVMFADRDMVIRYMNPASLDTLRGLEEHLPVKADDIVGSSLDIFHKDPSYQRKILADDKQLPRRANIQVGPETLDLLVSPIRDETGAYIGAMATWEVITD
jgi:truncated hemoglobin YjbI